MGNTLQLVIGFLGALCGGIVVALINWARTSRSEKASRRHEGLKDQIAKVYGPLYFFAGLNEALFSLSNKFREAYNEHFVGQKWSSNPHTQENLMKEVDATLGIVNHYVRIVRDNNSKIVDILRRNYSYIDPEDTEVFQQFIIDHLRMEREFQAEKPLETPLAIYLKVGEISYSRKEFMELVKKRFSEKNEILKNIR